MENWIELIIAILSGLVTAIPLAVQLVKYVKAAIQEKNWSKIMKLVLNLMTEAEKVYSTGAERKQYVISSIESIQDTLNYQIDMEQISKMIDEIVKASKTINAEVIVESK
jgi:esterase/lipase